ncbi:hypothetical protein AVEN_47325-1, partial [Araneus ventricosus]
FLSLINSVLFSFPGCPCLTPKRVGRQSWVENENDCLMTVGVVSLDRLLVSVAAMFRTMDPNFLVTPFFEFFVFSLGPIVGLLYLATPLGRQLFWGFFGGPRAVFVSEDPEAVTSGWCYVASDVVTCFLGLCFSFSWLFLLFGFCLGPRTGLRSLCLIPSLGILARGGGWGTVKTEKEEAWCACLQWQASLATVGNPPG